ALLEQAAALLVGGQQLVQLRAGFAGAPGEGRADQLRLAADQADVQHGLPSRDRKTRSSIHCQEFAMQLTLHTDRESYSPGQPVRERAPGADGGPVVYRDGVDGVRRLRAIFSRFARPVSPMNKKLSWPTAT